MYEYYIIIELLLQLDCYLELVGLDCGPRVHLYVIEDPKQAFFYRQIVP
jgi:hypothetical protein